MNNLRQIVVGVNMFANNNDNRYPPTMAYTGKSSMWSYSDLRNMAAIYKRSGASKRSLSSYLSPYLPVSSIFQCPSAPVECEDLTGMWQEGENWRPNNTRRMYRGSYSFYWDYVGYIQSRVDGEFDTVFRGAKRPAVGNRYSSLLVSDGMVFGEFGSQDSTRPAFTSCEWFGGASQQSGPIGEVVRSPHWRSESIGKRTSENCPNVSLHAGYADGHVWEYEASDALRIRRIIDRDMTIDSDPEDGRYPGPGEFYVPQDALPKGN
ncbi:hypothetical protein ACFL6U_14815 [Planctomycetota bacterium]